MVMEEQAIIGLRGDVFLADDGVKFLLGRAKEENESFFSFLFLLVVLPISVFSLQDLSLR